MRNFTVEVLTKFPARVDAGAGIGIDKENGVYTIAADYEGTAPISAPSDPTDTWVLVQQPDGSYARLPVSALKTAAADQINVFNYIPESYYGAIHAGTVTDDLSSYIQAAIDDAEVVGGTVEFPQGIYPCASTLTVKAAVALHGTSGDMWQAFNIGLPVTSRGTWLKFIGTTPSEQILVKHPSAKNGYNIWGFRMDGIALDGNRKASVGLHMVNTRYSRVPDLFMVNQISYGLLIEAINAMTTLYDWFGKVYHYTNINFTDLNQCISVAMLDGGEEPGGNPGGGFIVTCRVDHMALRPLNNIGFELGAADGCQFGYLDAVIHNQVSTDPASWPGVVFRGTGSTASNGVVQSVACRKNAIGYGSAFFKFENGTFAHDIAQIPSEFSSVQAVGDAQVYYKVHDFGVFHRDTFTVPTYLMRGEEYLMAKDFTANITAGSQAIATADTLNPALNADLPTLAFDQTTLEKAGVTFARPWQWNDGTCTVYAIHSSNSAAAGGVVVNMHYSIERDGGVVDTVLQFVTNVVLPQPAVAYKVTQSLLGTFTIDVRDILIHLTLHRNPSHASDDFAADWHLIGLRIEYVGDGPDSVAGRIWNVGPMRIGPL